MKAAQRAGKHVHRTPAGRRGGPCGPRQAQAATAPASAGRSRLSPPPPARSLKCRRGRGRPSPWSLGLQRPLTPRDGVGLSPAARVTARQMGGPCWLPVPAGRARSPGPLAERRQQDGWPAPGLTSRSPPRPLSARAACHHGPGANQNQMRPGRRAAAQCRARGGADLKGKERPREARSCEGPPDFVSHSPPAPRAHAGPPHPTRKAAAGPKRSHVSPERVRCLGMLFKRPGPRLSNVPAGGPQPRARARFSDGGAPATCPSGAPLPPTQTRSHRGRITPQGPLHSPPPLVRPSPPRPGRRSPAGSEVWGRVPQPSAPPACPLSPGPLFRGEPSQAPQAC